MSSHSTPRLYPGQRLRLSRWLGRIGGLLPIGLLLVLALPLRAQEAAPVDNAAVAEPPAQVRQFVTLLDDPEVRAWLAAQLARDAAPASEPAAPTVVQEETAALAALEVLREHIARVVTALPNVPTELGAAIMRLKGEVSDLGLIFLLPLVIGFIGAGWVAEFLFVRGSRKLRRKVLDASEATVAERVRKLALRLLLALVAVGVFAAASLGAFLLFDWPPMFRQVVGRFLYAYLLLRIGLVLGRILLQPLQSKLRVIPLNDEDAVFWFRRWMAFLGVFAIGWAIATSFRTLGAPLPVVQIVAYLFGLGLVAVAIEAILNRRKDAVSDAAADGDLSDMPSAVPTIIAIIYVLVLYALWLTGAMRIFWLGFVLGLLPPAIRVAQQAVNNLLRPVGAEQRSDAEPTSILAAVVERGARAGLIVGAAALLAWAWNIDLAAVARGDSGIGRLAGGLISVVVIALLADFVWHVTRTTIDVSLRKAAVDAADDDAEEIRRRARLRTLLPILRNVLFFVVVVTGILMALSAMGVQIGPLIAGAGVIGVAVGFGAQTLVRDVISGVFYLLDDAFRVGEYIISGAYKGTVESFSLRSIKLRHQRGPIFTVPFGSLGAIQNMSRDWVIDKLIFNVPHDTDLDKMKKVVKQVGKDMMAEPEIASGILEPLKMQGVNVVGDFAMTVALKMKCRPGQQFTARRRAYALLQKAFSQNGIQFAVPTVSVSGQADPAAVAAKQAMDLVQKPAAE